VGKREENGLAGDQRGAILLIALFIALSLAGALWTIVGIGDAIIQRDRGQEAADAAALSSAVVHARAMNATSALNFVMLAMTGAYLVGCVICDVALAAAGIILFDPRAAAQQAGLAFGQQTREGFATMIQFEQGAGATFAALDRAQAGLAVGAPSLGIVAANDAASHYRYRGVSLGWSNFSSAAIGRSGGHEKPAPAGTPPGTAGSERELPCFGGSFVCSMHGNLFPLLRNPPAWTAQANLGGSLGLPVAEEPASALCVRVGDITFRGLANMVAALNVPSGIDQFALEVLGGGARADLPLPVHCNDQVNRDVIAPGVAGVGRGRNVWSVRGPKRITGANGAMAMRVLAWAVGTDDATDESLRRVRLAAYQISDAKDTVRPVYDAQAEFYFNCGTGWNSAECNDAQIGESGVGYEHTLYWMKWRARLTRSKNSARVFGGALDNVIGRGGTVVAREGVPGDAWMKVADQLRSQANPKHRSLH
jgi:hypothetical protein